MVHNRLLDNDWNWVYAILLRPIKNLATLHVPEQVGAPDCGQKTANSCKFGPAFSMLLILFPLAGEQIAWCLVYFGKAHGSGEK